MVHRRVQICSGFSDLREMSRPISHLGERTILMIMYCHLESQMLLTALACGVEIGSAGSGVHLSIRSVLLAYVITGKGAIGSKTLEDYFIHFAYL